MYNLLTSHYQLCDPYSDVLEPLMNNSQCPNTTRSNLKRLVIKDMNSVDQIHLVVSMLAECMPSCAIEFSEDASDEVKPNKFVQALNKYADKADSMPV